MLPEDPLVLQEIQKDQKRSVASGYGSEMIDYAVEKLKPDIYLGIEDIWAFTGFYDKKWWNKINCIIHTTLDSLPILPDAISAAPKIKNYLVWSSFAEKALKELGHDHVRTIPGIVDTQSFYRLNDDQREKLRKNFGLDKSFIIGFVFRNQLRKSVPNLLDGFKIFIEKNPLSNAKLLLHTHWSEGWDILRLIKEKNIELNKVLTTYFCKNCFQYHIKPFQNQGIQCGYCKHPNACETTNIKYGVNEGQLNQIYNLMDVYCHPFTSGGQEIPIQEAKLTELITLATNYSCGEDACSEESGGLPLEWAEYREPGTQFIKASTFSTSIAEQIEKVYKMNLLEKRDIEKKARNFVLNRYSAEIIGKAFEELFDNLPHIEYEYKKEKVKCNPLYEPNNELADKEWIESLYENILKDKDENGTQHWMMRLKTDLKRNDVLNYFKKVAFAKNETIETENLLSELQNNPNQKRIAFIQPESNEEIIISTSLLPSIKKLYPNYKIYFFTKPEYFDLINSNPNIEKVVQYNNKMDDPLYFEGKADQIKYFDIVYAPYLSIRNNFTRNCEDKIEFEIYESH
jgi:glycosyltransferase involved in cell wall biosynthesis